MIENPENPSSTLTTGETGPLGLRRNPDLGAGRPPTPTEKPPLDPRVEASKTWPPAARQAARLAFEKATRAGKSRDEAISAGHSAGLRVARREERHSPEGVADLELVKAATSLLGARVVAVLPKSRSRDPTEDRCFERLFPDLGFPEPAGPPATHESGVIDDDESEKTNPPETPRGQLADRLANPPRQATLGFDREARPA